MRNIDSIIIHCSDTYPDMDIGVTEIREWHMEAPRNWSDIGYHYVIRRDGIIELGRSIRKPGAHCKGHNMGSIGICLVGGRSGANKPKDNFTPEQKDTLASLVRLTCNDYGPSLEVLAHCELDPNKTCPNMDINYLRATPVPKNTTFEFNEAYTRS